LIIQLPALFFVVNMPLTLRIKTLDSNNELILDIPNENIFVHELKRMIYSKSNVPPERQRLIFQGKVLADDKRISDYPLASDLVLHLVAMPVPSTSNVNNSSSSSSSSSGMSNSSGSGIGGVANVFNFGGFSVSPHGIILNAGTSPPSGTAGGSSNNNRNQQGTSASPVGAIGIAVDGSSVSSPMDLGGILSNIMNSIGRSFGGNVVPTQLSSSSSSTGTSNIISDASIPSMMTMSMPTTSSSSSSSSQTATTATTNTTTNASQPVQLPSASLIVHLHVNSNELDQLPMQLQRLQSMVNITSQPIITTNINAQPFQQSGNTTNPILNNAAVAGGINNLASMLGGLGNLMGANGNLGEANSNGGTGTVGVGGGGMNPALPQQMINVVRNVLQNGASSGQNLNSIVQDISGRLGLQMPSQSPSSSINSAVPSSEQNDDNIMTPLDSSLQVALQHLDVNDLMLAMSGFMGMNNANTSSSGTPDWYRTIGNKIREPIQRHVIEHILSNDTSDSHIKDIVDSQLESFQQSLKSDTKITDFLKKQLEQANSSSASIETVVSSIIDDFIDVCRYYYVALLEFLVESPGEQYLSRLLDGYLLDYIGDSMTLFSRALKGGDQDVKKLLEMTLQKYLDTMQFSALASIGGAGAGVGGDARGGGIFNPMNFTSQFGSSMISAYFLKKLTEYRTKYSGETRSLKKLAKSLSKSLNIVDSGNSNLNPSSFNPTAGDSSTNMIKKSMTSGSATTAGDGKDDILDDIDMDDILDSVKSMQPSTNISSSSSSSDPRNPKKLAFTSSNVGNNNALIICKQNDEQRSSKSWKDGMSAEEIRDIEATITKDEKTMRKLKETESSAMEDGLEELSESYKSYPGSGRARKRQKK